MESAVTPIKTDGVGSCSDSQTTNLHNFGLSVQAAIGPKVIDGRGLQGRVLIAFSIGADGSLMASRIAQSSGHFELDSQALKIVGKASFPTPPTTVSHAQRSYVSAFTFT